MRCPACQHEGSRVIDSRPGVDAASIRRRRVCERCEERFTTYERVEDTTPLVVKRDGRREPFERDKVRRAVSTACRKRPVPAEQIERIVQRVAGRFGTGTASEVPSVQIGELLLSELARVDEVAYARFASVYLRFETVGDFRALTVPAPKDEEPEPPLPDDA
jgi:transcriptional repressor NrdR